jgi:hypothetical protein
MSLHQEGIRWRTHFISKIFVDDGGIIGTPDAIKEVIAILGKVLKVRTMGELEQIVGCHTIDTNVKDGAWIHQPKYLKNLKENHWRHKLDKYKLLQPQRHLSFALKKVIQ